MKLVYEKTQKEVQIGDVVRNSTVVGITKPHKPSSTGRVTLQDGEGRQHQYFPVVIDAEWIEREDR